MVQISEPMNLQHVRSQLRLGVEPTFCATLEMLMRMRRSALPRLCEGALRPWFLSICVLMIAINSMLLLSVPAFAQADQGAITGTILDPQGRPVAGAEIRLTNTNTAFVVTTKSDQSGIYVFSPIKIGQYSVTCVAPGFKTETHSDLTLNVNARLGVNFQLQVGQVSETVTVLAIDEPVLQTEDSSTGQVMSSKVINETPLNQRNYVFIAHLAAGVEQTPAGQSRGQGNGDFDANGQRPDQNDFILDGVDNNSSAIDFLNGASYVIKPPPDALAEFKVQTGSYSAELGHSAGAVINASIKTGTNGYHGDVWEYFRNDALDARSFNPTAPILPGGRLAPLPEYRQNQFGATIGGPILKNHLFFFGDFEANRIVVGNSGVFTVPTLKMRQGDFSELLNPSLTGAGAPITLYHPGSGGSQLLGSPCGNPINVFCASEESPLALSLLNVLPKPNTGATGQTYNNYNHNLNQINNTAQFDGRIDWNINYRDQAFVRVSQSNNQVNTQVPFGPLDGGGYGFGGPDSYFSQNIALSETHSFTPTLINEFRFSFLYGNFTVGLAGLGSNVSAQLGLGGVPNAEIGGVPTFIPTGGNNQFSRFGSDCCVPNQEHQNNLEIVDNVTKIAGKHALKMGLQLQKIRSSFFLGGFPRGWYEYNGLYTSNPGAAPGVLTGSATADFLADQINNARVSGVITPIDQFRWYRAGYIQDDWKVTPRLTLNLGLRYDHFAPLSERLDRQSNLVVTSKGIGTGTAELLIPKNANAVFPQAVLDIFQQDHISIVRTGNRGLANAQNTNFAPRVGFAYSVMPNTVVRGAFGIFYGGLQNGFGTNIGANLPFQVESHFPAPTCTPGGSCQGNGISIETGFAAQLANGIANLPVNFPSFNAIQPNIQTPYTQSYNLTVQRGLSSSMTATVGYVGATGRHLQQNNYWLNYPLAIARPGVNLQPILPFPDLAQAPGINQTSFKASSNYNSLQATLEKRFTNGLYFLAAYTYAHSLDDDLTNNHFGIPQNINLIPLSNSYGSSDWDVRHRFTLNMIYELPFGPHRRFLNNSKILDRVIGGWSIGNVFVAQTGNPITVLPNNNWVSGAYPTALLTGDPFRAGGSPNATNPNTVCPSSVRNIQHWFNPCAFSNPPDANTVPVGVFITDPATVLQFVGHGKNQINGPGFHRLNTSIFKRFSTFESQYLEFRAEIFNTYNTPAYGQPDASMNPTGGQITGTRSLGANSPDGRFIQLALKYVF